MNGLFVICVFDVCALSIIWDHARWWFFFWNGNSSRTEKKLGHCLSQQQQPSNNEISTMIRKNESKLKKKATKLSNAKFFRGLIKWKGYTKKMSNQKIGWSHNMVVYEICVTTVVTLETRVNVFLFHVWKKIVHNVNIQIYWNMSKHLRGKLFYFGVCIHFTNICIYFSLIWMKFICLWSFFFVFLWLVLNFDFHFSLIWIYEYRSGNQKKKREKSVCIVVAFFSRSIRIHPCSCVIMSFDQQHRSIDL